jgi:hypothetical protein
MKISTQFKDTLFTIGAVFVTAIMFTVLLSIAGCTTTSYKDPSSGEEFTLTTWFKGVDGLTVVRGSKDEIFMLEISKTSNDQILPQIAEIMEAYK